MLDTKKMLKETASVCTLFYSLYSLFQRLTKFSSLPLWFVKYSELSIWRSLKKPDTLQI